MVAPVAQHAHELGRERLVEQLHHLLPVRRVRLGDGALADVPPGSAAQILYIRSTFGLLRHLVSLSGGLGWGLQPPCQRDAEGLVAL